MDSQQKADAKKILLDRITVCRHIADQIGGKIPEVSIIPVVTQIEDVLAYSFWCCKDCAEKHKVPKNGALVRYTDEQLLSEESNLLKHPFQALIDEEIVTSIPKHIFDDKFGKFDTDINLDSLTKAYFID